MTQQVKLVQTKIQFSLFKQAYQVQLQKKQDAEKARQFRLQALQKTFFQLWQGDYYNRNEEIKAFLQVNRRQKKKICTKVLDTWL